MSTSVNPDREDGQRGEYGAKNLLLRVLMAIRHSVILFTAFFGVILIAIGASPLVSGLFAGFFGIWGFTAVICAVLGFVGVRMLQLFDT